MLAVEPFLIGIGMVGLFSTAKFAVQLSPGAKTDRPDPPCTLIHMQMALSIFLPDSLAPLPAETEKPNDVGCSLYVPSLLLLGAELLAKAR